MRHRKNLIYIIYVIPFFLFILYCKVQEDSVKIHHGIVFFEEGKYGGWPANNGIWIWENEIFVGFVKADFKEVKGNMHTYNRNTVKNKYARSKDRGFTWSILDAYENGQRA